MRRAAHALVLPVLLASLATGGALAAEARAPSPTVDLKEAWIVAKGAAAEARFDVTCRPGDETVVLDAELSSDEFGVAIADATVHDVPCTGSPTQVVVALPLRFGQIITPDGWAVRYELTNCIERGECDTVSGRRYLDLEQKRFRMPFDDDRGAELRLRRARLTPAGDVRVAYDLTCETFRELPFGLESRLWQVQGDTLVGGWGRPDKFDDIGVFECSDQTQRLRYTVVAPGETRFRPRQAFVDTVGGQWFEWLTYATDRQVIRLEAPAG